MKRLAGVLILIFSLAAWNLQSIAVPKTVPLAAAKWLSLDLMSLEIQNTGDIAPDDQFFLVQEELPKINALAESSGQTLLKLLQQTAVVLVPNSLQERPLKLKLAKAVDLKTALRGPLQVMQMSVSNQMKFVTHVQTYPVIDAYFSEMTLPLGISWQQNAPLVRVWAPTARNVNLLLYADAESPTPRRVPMILESSTWMIKGNPDWKDQYYTFEVDAYSPFSGTFESHEVTDPYSVALSVDSKRSQIVDLKDPQLLPAQWAAPRSVFDPVNAVIYETHLRDLSALDEGLPLEQRGKFLALTSKTSLARKHIENLAKAGITHIHLLPFFDFATVPENSKNLKFWDGLFSGSDSNRPQSEIGLIRAQDNYNWGYDPLHFFAPEGSYTVAASAATMAKARILEAREMIASLHQMGLRVVADMVFNHSYANSDEALSTFDRIVPLYYHRRNAFGEVMTSSCCSDLATENVMMKRLIKDALKMWASEYQLDGFRFDLLNLHRTQDVAELRTEIRSWQLSKEGVDGKSLLLYGEAWPFGSLEESQPGKAFFLTRSFGQQVGVFNDRMRDAIRGGTTNSAEKSDQGFATGLFYDFNQEPANRNTPPELLAQQVKLLHLMDVIKVGLMGNLRDVKFRDHLNHLIRGGDLVFRGSSTGTAAEPVESINYVSAHDGYSLFDAVQAKLPFGTPDRNPPTATLSERAASQRLMLALVSLSQGVILFEGGSEILRSKSGDQDSFDSGDWFNALHWSFAKAENTWGLGLPPAWKNQSDWSFWQPRLVHKDLQVSKEEIEKTLAYFQALLRVRKSSRLFQLPTARMIEERMNFPADDKTGSDVPGLIVYTLKGGSRLLDPVRKNIVVAFNATRRFQSFQLSRFKSSKFNIHSELVKLNDPDINAAQFSPLTGEFQIPPQCTIVWEEFF